MNPLIIYIWKIRKDNVPPNYKIRNKCKLLNIILQWWIGLEQESFKVSPIFVFFLSLVISTFQAYNFFKNWHLQK